jgi:hypothetical protein
VMDLSVTVCVLRPGLHLCPHWGTSVQHLVTPDRQCPEEESGFSIMTVNTSFVLLQFLGNLAFLVKCSILSTI